MRTAIGVDIGGTNLSVGLVSDEGKVLELVRERTPVDGAAAADLLLEMTRRLLAAVETPVGIGLGFVGVGFLAGGFGLCASVGTLLLR